MRLRQALHSKISNRQRLEKAVLLDLKGRAKYLSRSRAVNSRGGNFRIKNTMPVGKLELSPSVKRQIWVWVQLDVTTDSVKEWSRETITALVRRGR